MVDYEVKTMQGDIEKLKDEGAPPFSEPTPPEALLVSDKLPGEPLPSEPTASTIIPEPPQPIKPVELEQEEIKTAPEKKPKRLFAIIGILLIIIALGVGGFFLFKYLKGTKLETPESLISVEETKIIEIAQGEEITLLDKIKTEAKEFQAEGTMKRILVKGENSDGKYFLSLENLINALNIRVPADVLINLGQNYTVFIYSGITGAKLGLVIESTGSNLWWGAKEWESTVGQDLLPIFLGFLSSDLLENLVFADGKYNDIDFRYVNAGDSLDGIAYTVINNKFLITTSRDNFRSAVDRLLQ